MRSAASIILRGPSDMYCDEMERSIHDALCVVKVCINLFLYMAYTKQIDVYYSNLILAILASP